MHAFEIVCICLDVASHTFACPPNIAGHSWVSLLPWKFTILVHTCSFMCITWCVWCITQNACRWHLAVIPSCMNVACHTYASCLFMMLVGQLPVRHVSVEPLQQCAHLLAMHASHKDSQCMAYVHFLMTRLHNYFEHASQNYLCIIASFG
jgi:hypothetical protein